MARRAKRTSDRFKSKTNSLAIYDRLSQSSLIKVASWSMNKELSLDSSLSIKCIKHDHHVRKGVKVTYLLQFDKRSTGKYCPNCPHCIKEKTAYARSKKSPALKTIRNDCYWRFNEDDVWSNMPTHFYVTNISRMFHKFGIAKNYAARALNAKYQGLAYQENLFLSKQYPRAWVWTAEQVIKHATTDYAPKCSIVNGIRLDQWVGASELRRKQLTSDRIIGWFLSLIHLIQTKQSWRSVFWSSINQMWTMQKLDEISADFHSSAMCLAE